MLKNYRAGKKDRLLTTEMMESYSMVVPPDLSMDQDSVQEISSAAVSVPVELNATTRRTDGIWVYMSTARCEREG